MKGDIDMENEYNNKNDNYSENNNQAGSGNDSYQQQNSKGNQEIQYPSSQYRYSYNQIKQDYSYHNQGAQDYNYSNQGAQTYNNSGYYSGYSTPYTTYPTPETTSNTKKNKAKSGKWRGFKNALKLTASAVVFGIIAGAVFQGFTYFTEPKGSIENNRNEGRELNIMENTEPSALPTKISSDEIVTDVSDIVANVMPSIVAINSSSVYTSYDFFGRQYNEPVEGSGSGIIIGQNGSEILIVTNNHVIEGAQTVEIVFSDETTAQAVVKGAEARSDLAVLSVDLDDLSEETASIIKVATLGNSELMQPGQMVIAIGNALGYGQSVTVGYVSAVNREVTIDNINMTLLQTDAAINPGNSGGALINTSGEVIGINSVKYASKEVEGMGYAIPISDALPMINELITREKIETEDQGFLGVYLDSAQEVTELYAERFNMPIGVYINQVVEGSPADQAGLKQGHIIVGIDKQKIKTIDDLLNILSYRRAGDEIKLVIKELQNGEYVERTLNVTLGKKK